MQLWERQPRVAHTRLLCIFFLTMLLFPIILFIYIFCSMSHAWFWRTTFPFWLLKSATLNGLKWLSDCWALAPHVICLIKQSAHGSTYINRLLFSDCYYEPCASWSVQRTVSILENDFYLFPFGWFLSLTTNDRSRRRSKWLPVNSWHKCIKTPQNGNVASIEKCCIGGCHGDCRYSWPEMRTQGFALGPDFDRWQRSWL